MFALLASTAAAQQSPDEIARLAAMLTEPGADGREARERAIERLMASDRVEAHAVLHARLRAADDPDGLRLAIAASLQRHFVLAPEMQFGGASGPQRQRLLAEWLRVIVPSWSELRRNAEDPGSDPVRSAMRMALQRLPTRELDGVARSLLAGSVAEEKVLVMRCLADMQHTLFAATIAEQLDAADATVRAGAQDALQLLTCSDEPIRTRDQFAAWFAQYGMVRYVDLVERAARRVASPNERLRDEIARLRVDAAREVVRAHIVRSSVIDWAAVQARVCVDDPQVLDACLALMQTAVPVAGDDASPARQALCRALVQRFHAEPADASARRAALLEVAAYLGRGEDVELAAELRALLVGQLDLDDVVARGAALRGLRRYPTAETRARLVRLAQQLLAAPPSTAGRGMLEQVLATLSSRSAPRWMAPLPSDADKPDWLQFVDAACRNAEAPGLRESALALAHVLDARDQRVPEVFDLLLGLVRDAGLDTKFRSTCAIHLQGWRNEPTLAESWVRAQQELLADAAPELRILAAESLVMLADSADTRRTDWILGTILAVRSRLASEPDPAVFRKFVECVRDLGRQPAMPEMAIGALRYALEELGATVAVDQQFRLDPLLEALATIGGDPRADRGQWLAACDPLLVHRRRQSLRLILQNHAAADLAVDVGKPDGSLAERARRAMRLLIETAALKPPRESWTGNEELLREARDVRAAFGALDALDETQRVDGAQHRLLRLEVDLAAGKPQDVVQRGTAWLANGNGRPPQDAEHRSRLQLLVAEAQLLLGRPAEARKLVEERGESLVVDAALLDLETRIARSLVATDLAGAVAMLDHVVRRTAVEEPAFRARLVEWMSLRLRFDPALREETLRLAETHAPLFAAADCPADLREAFEQVRAQR